MKYLGAYIFHDGNGYWYWLDSYGVIGGEGFESIDECKKDVDIMRSIFPTGRLSVRR